MLESQIREPHYPRSHQRSCQQPRAFGSGNPLAERNTLRVVVLTAVMMVIEIICGMLFNSMALLADGWHMGTHAVAIGLSALAYIYARRYAEDSRFAFGTWKIEVLGGYTSAILLALVALVMAYESLARLLRPTAIQYDEAIAVAVVGLVVNLICAWLLNGGHPQHDHHDHHDPHDQHNHHDPHHQHHDLNLRSAYLHVIADASTSVLAILALLGGKYWGASWLDPVMGIVGSILVAVWAYGLIRDTAHALLDAEMNAPIVQEIHRTIEQGDSYAQIRDLHVWRVGNGKYACILAIATTSDVSAEDVRRQLSAHQALAHVSVEVIRAGDVIIT
jgi:cation diffusion facilitator family transporter